MSKLSSLSLRPLLATALTLLVLSACGSNAQLPTASGPNAAQGARPANQASTQTSAQAGGQASGQASGQSSGQASGSISAELRGELTTVHDDEAIYADSVAVAEGESSFSTQALTGAARLDARLRVPGIQPVATVGLSATQRRQRAADALRLDAAERASLKAHLLAGGAVTVNADGSLTIDAKAFKAQVSQQLQNRKQRFQDHLAKLQARLELKRQIVGERLKQLRHHDFIVRTSDKVSTTNADGSVTETVKISFENSKHGIKRETVLAKTSLDGKVIKVEFELDEKTPAFERSLTRIATHNADGTRNVLIDASTKWKNGRTHERHEERVIAADGSGTGTGTLTLTKADGSVKNRTFTINFGAAGEMTSSASDEASDTEVIIAEEADGEATVIETEDGEETAEAIDLDAEAEAAAEADASASAEGDADASAEASADASAEASAES